MADKSQRTEQPTAKHRKEIREKGKVARSTELGAWASLLAVAVLLPRLAGMAVTRVDSFLGFVVDAISHPSTSEAMAVLAKGLVTAAVAALPIVLVCTGIGVVSSFAQVGLRFTPKALTPQFCGSAPKPASSGSSRPRASGHSARPSESSASWPGWATCSSTS
jgi:flagellar biosynthetic protein FlhB